MKRLKFSDNLPQLILEGKKSSTWRLNDDRGIVAGDQLSLCDGDGSEFAQAYVIEAYEKPFGNLDAQDWDGHEPFESPEQMYATYSRYYQMPVDEHTTVKIIKFTLHS